MFISSGPRSMPMCSYSSRIGHPSTIGVYKPEDPFMPTEIAVAPNGDFYVADGYGIARVPFAYNYFVIVGPADEYLVPKVL